MFAVVVAVVSDSSELAACAPPSARVLDVTVLPVPTAAVSNVPVPLQVTTSDPTSAVSGKRVALGGGATMKKMVAVIAGISVAAVMLAVVVAVVAGRRELA